MADIPEHLLKRSAERRKALGLRRRRTATRVEERLRPTRRAEAAPTRPRRHPPRPRRPAEAPAAGGGESKGGVPAHLLERAAARRDAPRWRRRRRRRGRTRGRRRRRHRHGDRDAHHRRRRRRPGPGGHTQRLLTVVKSGSIQQTKAEAQDKVHTWPHLLVRRVRGDPRDDGGAAHLLGARAGAAARPRRRQPDAEPVEGAVVLPRPAGAPHDVPPDGRRRDHPGHGALPADGRAVRRQEPVAEARTTGSS